MDRQGLGGAWEEELAATLGPTPLKEQSSVCTSRGSRHFLSPSNHS